MVIINNLINHGILYKIMANQLSLRILDKNYQTAKIS